MTTMQTANIVEANFQPDAGVGLRLRSIRERRGENLDEFARVIGVGRSSLYNYEKGKRDLTVPVLKSLEAKLGIDPTWLVTGNQVQAQPLKEVFEEHTDLIARIGKIATAEGLEMTSSTAYDIAVAALLLARDARGQGAENTSITDASLAHLIKMQNGFKGLQS